MPLKLLVAFALGCILNTAAPAQNSSKYLKTMGQEGYTLYFIAPVSFKGEKVKASLEPDFTFQHQKGLPEWVDLKFSLFSRTPFREMGHLSFLAGDKTIGQSSGSTLMFLEQRKGKWQARFATRIPYSTLMDMLNAGEKLEIRFHSQDTILAFPAGRKWGKVSAVTKEILSAQLRPEEKE